MSKPSDKPAASHQIYHKDPTPIRKSPAHAEFREETPPEPLRTKGKTRPRNRDDQRNVRFILIALIVSMLIFIALELKQRRDAIIDVQPATPDSVQNK
jgi:hypothetical protein